MEVKILCPCGAKYKFEVEPVNGKLPGPVLCPVCAADGTALGNEIVAQTLTRIPLAAAPTPSTAAAVRISTSGAQAPQSSRSGFVAPVVPKSSKEVQPPPAAPVRAVPHTPAPVAQVLPVAQPPPPAGAVRPIAPSSGAPRLSVQAVHSPAAAESPASAPALPSPAAARASAPTAVSEPSFTRGVIGIAAASFVGLLIWFALTLFFGPKFKWAAIGI